MLFGAKFERKRRLYVAKISTHGWCPDSVAAARVAGMVRIINIKALRGQTLFHQPYAEGYTTTIDRNKEHCYSPRDSYVGFKYSKEMCHIPAI